MERLNSFAKKKVQFAPLLMAGLLIFSACKPSEEVIPEETEVSENGNQTGNETETPNPNPGGGSSVTEGYYADEIQKIAASSSCSTYSWANRGKAPMAYMKGMALTFAKSYCRLRTTEASPTGIVNILVRPSGSATSDALAHYQSTYKSLGMDITSNKAEILKSLYTLGVGLGMRETSGKYCTGRDSSASNTSASTAEAGLFQTSYNSMSASTELRNLFMEYKADPSKCFLDVFKVGVSCSNTSIYGTGEGAEYQAFNKSCPAFATEYAMMMLRLRRNHYGPINRQEAQIISSCNKMLSDVQAFLDRDLNGCDEVI